MAEKKHHEDSQEKPANKWENLVEEEEEIAKTPGLELPDRELLEKQLTENESKVFELEDKLLRIRAEMDNIQRRAKTDVENAHKYAIKGFASELLRVVDALEQSLEAHRDEMESIREGVELTLKLLLDALTKNGIQPINPLQQMFNPTFHEAMSTEVRDDVQPGKIVKVLQKGYQLNDRLLRPALVIVAKAP